jgi:DNA-binding response OmpR family regulator
MNILIGVEEEILLSTIQMRLRRYSFETTLTRSGDELRAELQTGNFDLVVIDHHMSSVDTLEFIAYLRKERKSDIPLIILFEQEEREMILEAMKVGGNDFLLKPFKPVELVLRIRSILQS